MSLIPYHPGMIRNNTDYYECEICHKEVDKNEFTKKICMPCIEEIILKLVKEKKDASI